MALPPKTYAEKIIKVKWPNSKQFDCLEQLWTKESNWRPNAYNKIKVGGRNAGGIPQILGLDPKLHHTIQIDRGVKYIKHRYETPCNAWAFWQRKGWY
jgi:hypothetical protein